MNKFARDLVIPGLLLLGLVILALTLGSLEWFDGWVTNLVSALPGWMEPFFTVVAAVGSMAFLIFFACGVAAVEAANKRWVRAGVMLGSLLALPAFFAMKQVVQRARPVTDLVWAYGDFSFPSGHTAGSTAVYGMAAILIANRVSRDKRKWVYLGFGTLIFLIGLSRVYLGAHFPTDVLGGWILGSVFVIILSALPGDITTDEQP